MAPITPARDEPGTRQLAQVEGKRRGRDIQIRGQFGRRVSLRPAPDEQAEDGKPGFGSQRTERIQGLSRFHLSNLMELCAGRQVSDRIGGGMMVEREGLEPST